jgi:fructan beta-fructosidase
MSHNAPPDSSTEDRPRIHFAVPSGWLNDPNGMVYHEGEYHLFYQHHPYSTIWGPMHWGHAVSRDMVHWEDLPIALAPDAEGAIFSGSAVVDRENSAGFGAGALVAVFTQDGARQVQSIAASVDHGRTWQKYAGNPVLAPADAPVDFRDPRVFRYDAPGGGHWVMALAVSQEIWFYTSPDLKRWRKASAFGAGYGAHGGVWECPELVRLPVDGGPDARWVLIVSVGQGGPAGGSGTQYFVGDFDGERFMCEDPPGTVRWADYGADFYAPQAWHNAPGGRTIWLAWMNNWEYARDTPATTWRGMMSAPRELTLTRADGRITLAQRFPPELFAGWRTIRTIHDLPIPAGALITDADARGETLLLEATFALDGTTATRFGLQVRAGDGTPATVGYDRERQALFVEGTHAWRGDAGATVHEAPLHMQDGLLRLNILVDTCSVEALAADGRAAITDQIFPTPGSDGVRLFAEGGAARLVELRVQAPY